jgi:hypothetical protein
MRTTVRLNDQLLKEAKRYALEHNQTLTDLIEKALHQMIQPKAVKQNTLPTRALGKALVNIDFSDSSAVQDFLDQGLDVRSRR